MKAITTFVLTTSFLAGVLCAKTYSITEEDKAFAEAKQKNKAIAYVVAWDGWAPLVAAREAALKIANSEFIVIAGKFNANYYKHASPLVASQFKVSSKNTLLTPQVIVVSEDGLNLIGSIAGPAATEKKNYKSLTTAVDSYFEDGTLMTQPRLLKFYTSSTSYRNVDFVGVTDNSVIIKGKKKNAQLPFEKIQPGSVKFAKRYAAHEATIRLEKKLTGLQESFSYPAAEEWISSAGKTVTAEYVSLENDTLNLVIKKKGYTDKSFKLGLEKLDEASQEKARKWKTQLEEQESKIQAAKEKLGANN